MPAELIRSNGCVLTSKGDVPASKGSDPSNWLDEWIVLGALTLAIALCIVHVCTGACVSDISTDPVAKSTGTQTQTVTEASAASCAIVTQDQDPTRMKSPATISRSIASSGEQETCNALIRLLHKPFVKVRPSFLINPETGRRLELDCFNEELMLAVEFSGVQHYVYPNPFHRSQEQFDAQVRRDRYKVEQCKAQGVRFIVVPFTVKRAHIESYLRLQLLQLNIGLGKTD